MSNFKQIFLAASLLVFTLSAATSATAQRPIPVKTPAPTVKEAAKETNPNSLSKTGSVKVVVANNFVKKAEKIVVTVYALPARAYKFGDATLSHTFYTDVVSGKITESNYKLPDNFNNFKYFYETVEFTDKATVEKYFYSEYKNLHQLPWTQKSQEISLEPKAVQTLTFKMLPFYVPPTGDAEADKVGRIIKTFSYVNSESFPPNSYFVYSPKTLTFQQSVFYVEVKDATGKPVKEASYFIPQ